MSYLRYALRLTQGLKHFQSNVGRRLLATLVLPFDGLADSIRGGFFSALPGHPEQYEDSLDQCAKDRGLIKFGNEAPAVWRAYVRETFETYAKFTTEPGVLEAVERWGEANFPGVWPADTATLVETGFANFDIILPSGLGLAIAPQVHDDPDVVYDTDDVYGAGVSARQIALLRAAVRQAKPARSKAYIVIPDAFEEWAGVLLGPTATITVSGSAVGTAEALEVTMTSTGATGAATFHWDFFDDGPGSEDGDATTGASVALGSTGLTLHFSGSFVDTDFYEAREGFNFISDVRIKV